MTKLIAALIIAAVLFVSYQLFLYWDRVKNAEETARKEAAAKVITSGDQLQGMPYQLNEIYRNAEKQGATGIRAFLKGYGASIQDPRKAWIELDLCQLISRENPAEARRIYAEVKGRTPPDSPVTPRIKQLERTFQ
jgi:hypothetical protein